LLPRAELCRSVREGVCSELRGPGRVRSDLCGSSRLCASVRRSRGLRSGCLCADLCGPGGLCSDLRGSRCLLQRERLLQQRLRPQELLEDAQVQVPEAVPAEVPHAQAELLQEELLQ
jgi:hypothetical protein